MNVTFRLQLKRKKLQRGQERHQNWLYFHLASSQLRVALQRKTSLMEAKPHQLEERLIISVVILMLIYFLSMF